MTDPRRAMPSVSGLLETVETKGLLEAYPRSVVVNAVRQAIAEARRGGSSEEVTDWAGRIESQIRTATTRSLRPLFNATGVVLHTNLGRAPLAQSAIDAVREVAEGFSNL